MATTVQIPSGKVWAMTAEVQKIITKGVTKRTSAQHAAIVSNIFTHDKADGMLSVILDLSDLNDSVVY